MKTGELLLVSLADDSDSIKKRRRQARRSKQTSMENGAPQFTMDTIGIELSNSYPSPPPSTSLSSEHPNKISGRKYFAPYLSDEAVEEAVERGNAFKSTFRANAHNRLEAYCTLKGVPVDVLINGVEAQNRAIDGDVVAVALDPVADWSKLKGSTGMVSLNSKLDADSCSAGGRSEGSNVLPQVLPCASSSTEQCEVDRALDRICAMINSHPLKRPTGRVVAILKRSPKRLSVIGFLSVKQCLADEEGMGRLANGHYSKKNKSQFAAQEQWVEWIHLIPTDPRFPKMMVSIRSLPGSIKERVMAGDINVERELVAAELYEWNEEVLYPFARVIDVFGRGGEIEPRIAAILFENSICAARFSSESLACLPNKPWKIPEDELESRKDLRNICCFTIDPSSAIELDDALSVEVLSDEIFRVGVHIADVSYFVLPDTALDAEIQARSTSVYILQNKISMLPPELSEELCSILPGEDRLVFSIIWDINHSGKVINRWIGRSIINSCCKLSYDFVQDLIEKSFVADKVTLSASASTKVHEHFSMKDAVGYLEILYEISNKLRETRFNDGALELETFKFGFLFDEYGAPYESIVSERKESCCLVEEFMLLANRTVAEVISQAFPDCALLRRHPEPNLRKLKEFEAFCSKHGFELDTSSSGQLHLSLLKIKEKIKNDPVLFDIVVSYASRPMQSAVYFCTGDLKGKQNEWAHYGLSVPLYTHFTSPIRRYPDIIVHRTLCAVLHAEEMYLKQNLDNIEASEIENVNTCFTGLHFNKHAAESSIGREVLSSSALKFKIADVDALGELAAHCNERKLASRHAEEAGEKLYLWALLKKKETLVTEARVLALGPKFMSVYIQNFGMERRIYYDDVECLAVEWLEMTGTLILDLIRSKIIRRRGAPGKFRPLEDVVFLREPSASGLDEENTETISFRGGSANITSSVLLEKSKPEAVFFPLVLHNLSPISVTLHAIGGDDGPLDIGVKLFMTSYFS